MHLRRIRATNFRAFGDGTSAPVLDWALSPGLNILVGENDAGKTAIIDAIRCALWTTSYGLDQSRKFRKRPARFRSIAIQEK
jgi:putative ATP-dependent endonuclease of OLD family